MILKEKEVEEGECYILLNPNGTKAYPNRVYLRIDEGYVLLDHNRWSHNCAKDNWYISKSAARTSIMIVDNPLGDHR